MHVGEVLPAHDPPVQRYEVGPEVQLAVSTADPPGKTLDGSAAIMQTGFVGTTVTATLAKGPVPALLTPATEYVVVVAGATVQVSLVVVAQAPPVQV